MRFLTWHYIIQPSREGISQDFDAAEHSPSLPRQTPCQLGSATTPFTQLSSEQNTKYLPPTAANKLGDSFWPNFNNILGIEL